MVQYRQAIDRYLPSIWKLRQVRSLMAPTCIYSFWNEWWKTLTVSILYPDHKIPAWVCDSLHNTPRILWDWSLSKQLSCQEIIHTKQCRNIYCLLVEQWIFVVFTLLRAQFKKNMHAVKCNSKKCLSTFGLSHLVIWLHEQGFLIISLGELIITCLKFKGAGCLLKTVIV